MKIKGITLNVSVETLWKVWNTLFRTKVVQTETPKDKDNYPIKVGECLPWKGFWFRIVQVNKDGFVAKVEELTGRTKRWNR